MEDFFIAVGILGGLGLIFGVVLAVASRVFHVEEDPRLEPMTQALPGANCGGCGFAGCGAYAQAVLEGKAPIGKCASGGEGSAKKMAQILGVKAEKVTRQVALVRCAGFKGVDEDGKSTGARMKGEYQGLQDCLAATKVAGRGPLICKFGCLGFGNCTKACKYDAIHVENGVAKVDPEKCRGCMQCAAQCPRGLIVPVEYGSRVVIACASQAKGSVTIRGCTAGCIGCGLCKKACPENAIQITRNLAVIDHTKCTACGLCLPACPKKLITKSDRSSAAL